MPSWPRRSRPGARWCATTRYGRIEHPVAARPAGRTGGARLGPGAGAWPAGPIRIIAPFPPGGSVDTIARLLVPALQASLGVPVVVENRSGAAGAVGTQAAARAAPDGNTWVLVFDSHATVNALNPNAGFDTKHDFAPVMLLATAPMLLTTPAARPWTTLAGVPPPILARFHAALAAAMAGPVVRQRLVEGQGVVIRGSSPAEFGGFLEKRVEVWGAIVRGRNIRLD